MKNQNNDTYSLAHTTWKCQYHIVFTPKYHRKIIYGALREEIGKILRELCYRKEVEIIEAHAMPDHIHMLVSIPPNEKVKVGGRYVHTIEIIYNFVEAIDLPDFDAHLREEN